MTEQQPPRKRPSTSNQAGRRPPGAKKPGVKKSRSSSPPSSSVPLNFNAKLQELWRGTIPLIEVFWIYYFAVLFMLKFIGDFLPVFDSIFGLLEIVWAGFMIQPVLLAANRYQGQEYWKITAQVAVFILGAAVLLDGLGKIL